MKYDEDTAREIIQRYGLASATLKVWRHRGSIPQKYASPDYDATPPALLKDTLRAVEITQLPELNVSAFTGVAYRKVIDVTRHHLRGKRASQNFTESEITALKSEVTRLRNKIRRFTVGGKEKELAALIAEPRIKHYVLFAGEEKMLARMYKKSYVEEQEIESCRVLAARLYNQLNW